MPDEFVINHRKHSSKLDISEVDLLLEAQRDILRINSGVLGLTDDLEFLTLRRVGCDEPKALLAIREENDYRWIQIAYTRPDCRRQGMLTKLIKAAICEWGGAQKIGLGTGITNIPMRMAAGKCGFQQTKCYLWRQPTGV